MTALRIALREPISTMTHLRVDEILAGATLILALAVLVVRFASATYGSGAAERETKTD